jgi:hypothetical protein
MIGASRTGSFREVKQEKPSSSPDSLSRAIDVAYRSSNIVTPSQMNQMIWLAPNISNKIPPIFLQIPHYIPSLFKNEIRAWSMTCIVVAIQRGQARLGTSGCACGVGNCYEELVDDRQVPRFRIAGNNDRLWAGSCHLRNRVAE